MSNETMLGLVFLFAGTLFFLAVMCLAEIRLAERQSRNLRRALKRERLVAAPPAKPTA